MGILFYVDGDLMMRRGMLPIITLPDGDLRIALHLVPFWKFGTKRVKVEPSLDHNELIKFEIIWIID